MSIINTERDLRAAVDEETLKSYLEVIAVKGTENRFQQITMLLDSLGLTYEIQSKTNSYQKPIYEKAEKVSYTSPLAEELFLEEEPYEQLSLFFDGFSDMIAETAEVVDTDVVDDDSSYFDEEEADDDDVYEQLFQDINLECDVVDDFRFLDEIIMTDFYRRKEQKRRSKWGWGGGYFYQPARIIGYETVSDEIRNIIIHFVPDGAAADDKRLLLCAHYDAVVGSTAANDNGSSVAILIELARLLNDPAVKITRPIDIVFMDREETGGLGCNLYLSDYLNQIEEVINLDTCGVGNVIVMNDLSSHKSDATVGLVKGKSNFETFDAKSLPYCDTNIMTANKLDVVTICSLPDNDIRKMQESQEVKEKALEVKGFKYNVFKVGGLSSFPTEVYKYMHNGEFDDIAYINYILMGNILKLLLYL